MEAYLLASQLNMATQRCCSSSTILAPTSTGHAMAEGVQFTTLHAMDTTNQCSYSYHYALQSTHRPTEEPPHAGKQPTKDIFEL